MEELIKILLSKPSIQKVYFNEKGEWLFHSRPTFPIVKTREELIEEKPKLKKVKSNDLS